MPPSAAGAAVSAALGSFAAVSAEAKLPAIRLAGRIMASRILTAIAGLPVVYECQRMLIMIPFPRNSGQAIGYPHLSGQP